MPQAYTETEHQLVEQPAIGWFAALGWTMGVGVGGNLGATHTLRLRSMLARLNPGCRMRAQDK